MKIISLVVFMLALIGSWYLSHREQAVPEAVHQSLQNDLKRIIAEYIQKNLPNSKNLDFKRFWTEDIGKGKVKASFAYTFDDESDKSGAVNMEIEGTAVLNKVSETADSSEWSMDELKISNNAVEYKDGIKVTPNGATDQVPENDGKGEPGSQPESK